MARVGASHQVLLTSVLQPAASRQQRAQHGGLVGGTKARYLVTSHTLWSPWNISVSQFLPHNTSIITHYDPPGLVYCYVHLQLYNSQGYTRCDPAVIWLLAASLTKMFHNDRLEREIRKYKSSE